jgi:hypothetical protein
MVACDRFCPAEAFIALSLPTTPVNSSQTHLLRDRLPAWLNGMRYHCVRRDQRIKRKGWLPHMFSMRMMLLDVQARNNAPRWESSILFAPISPIQDIQERADSALARLIM